MGLFGLELGKYARVANAACNLGDEIIAVLNLEPKAKEKAQEAMGLVRNLALILVGVPK